MLTQKKSSRNVLGKENMFDLTLSDIKEERIEISSKIGTIETTELIKLDFITQPESFDIQNSILENAHYLNKIFLEKGFSFDNICPNTLNISKKSRKRVTTEFLYDNGIKEKKIRKKSPKQG